MPSVARSRVTRLVVSHGNWPRTARRRISKLSIDVNLAMLTQDHANAMIRASAIRHIRRHVQRRPYTKAEVALHESSRHPVLVGGFLFQPTRPGMNWQVADHVTKTTSTFHTRRVCP